MSFETVPVFQRLLNGAKAIGILHRSGEKCDLGWAAICGVPTSKLCRAKNQWVQIAFELGGRPPADGPYGFLEMMSASELEASGITLVVDLPEIGRVRVGQKGEISMKDFSALSKNPAGMESVLKVLTTFPGAKVVEIAETALTAPR